MGGLLNPDCLMRRAACPSCPTGASSRSSIRGVSRRGNRTPLSDRIGAAPEAQGIDLVDSLCHATAISDVRAGVAIAARLAGLTDESSFWTGRPAANRCNIKMSLDGRSATGTIKHGGTHRIHIECRAPGHIDCSCSCRMFHTFKRACEHIVAFLLLFDVELEEWMPKGNLSLCAIERNGETKLTPGTTEPPWILEPEDVANLAPACVSPAPVGSPSPDSTTPNPAAPLPGVYVLRSTGEPGLTSTLVGFRRSRISDGRVALEQVPLRFGAGGPLDTVDAAIIDLVDRLPASHFHAMSGSHAVAGAMLAAARAGRLHCQRVPRTHRDAGPSRGRLGPPTRWQDDQPWQPEIHFAPAAPPAEGAANPEHTREGPDPNSEPNQDLRNGMRCWLRLVAEGHDPIDCLDPSPILFAHALVNGDRIFDTDARDSHGRYRFSGNVLRLMQHGPELIAPSDTRDALEDVRYMGDNWSDAADPDGDDRPPRIVVDPRLGITHFQATPKPVIRLDGGPQRSTVDVVPMVRYIHPDDPTIVVDRDSRTNLLVEDPDRPLTVVPCGDLSFEDAFTEASATMFRRAGGKGHAQWRLPRAKLPALLRAAAKRGYAVELQKQPARAGGRWSLSVASGIDWFELDGQLETPEGPIPLKELVRAARAAPGAVEILPLADGTTVILPTKLRGVLRKLARIMHARDNESIRFAHSEALLVNTLLEAADRSRDDAAFRALRTRLKDIELPRKVPTPSSFVGTLRDYQQASLAWFAGLRELGMGGCLADEMGLGKTIQVLAMLAAEHVETHAKPRKTSAAKRTTAAPRRPTLLVVPRSIVRNWIEEASRFVPQLRIADLSQGDRDLADAAFDSLDVAVVTYGTLLRDIETLSRREFQYVILDEAQAIKNQAARTTKAAKCLRAQHRLAMTGTPIENHLGELWSLMEFLNPALAARLELLAGSGETDELDTVRRAIRPFLLRRAKRDVAKELPDRIEQTMHCEMTAPQRAHYDELLKRIRHDLLNKSDVEFGRSKLDVLEGLLRLRQVACHPCLVDRSRSGAGSGKLDALLPMLEESAMEGRKTLVFSQFTSFLAIVRRELEQRGLSFEYLDGQTRDRAERVRRFATDDSCHTFLLSLKAGGVGLNLQCAERVVLLDPWWNPAVEAQAIDRTHRIGQTRSVHAIRLVSAGTVEDRVLELQSRKRALADAIVSGEAGPLASMTREDLAFLLGTG